MALPSGAKAQEFTLTSTTGKPVTLSELTKRGPVVLAFFKVSCPTCQYAFPYFERMSQLHKPEAVSFVGISQNDLRDTQAFMKQYGVTFPVAIDDSKQYIVSNAYKLTNVPTAYLVDRDGRIQVNSVGWARKDMEEINAKLSMMDSAQQQHPIFKPGEEVAEYKAG
ncbi:MAG TPA: TlpA disulfide reductase family protein [Terriglobales bacterium]|jgi:peroxiredoxin|nr:TlpA disulfide reductase family protein [Terriglobales bacterium]